MNWPNQLNWNQLAKSKIELEEYVEKLYFNYHILYQIEKSWLPSQIEKLFDIAKVEQEELIPNLM